MKRISNFEALFLAAAAVATFASYASAASTDLRVRAAPQPAAVVQAAPAGQMQVVVIKGQRLSAAQKAAL
jgi:hypothetical protein